MRHSLRTFKDDRLSRARRVNKDLRFLLSTSLVPKRDGTLPFAVPMVCEGEVVSVLVCEDLPEQRDALTLTQKENAVSRDVL